MRILTIHRDLNTAKIWEGVKSFSSFKSSLEINRDLQNKLDYFLIESKDYIEMLPNFLIQGDQFKIYRKDIYTTNFTEYSPVSWIDIPIDERYQYYEQNELDQIEIAKSFTNHVGIEIGAIEAPENYPLIPMVSYPRLVNKSVEELVLNQSIKVRAL